MSFWRNQHLCNGHERAHLGASQSPVKPSQSNNKGETDSSVPFSPFHVFDVALRRSLRTNRANEQNAGVTCLDVITPDWLGLHSLSVWTLSTTGILKWSFSDPRLQGSGSHDLLSALLGNSFILETEFTKWSHFDVASCSSILPLSYFSSLGRPCHPHLVSAKGATLLLTQIAWLDPAVATAIDSERAEWPRAVVQASHLSLLLWVVWVLGQPYSLTLQWNKMLGVEGKDFGNGQYSKA